MLSEECVPTSTIGWCETIFSPTKINCVRDTIIAECHMLSEECVNTSTIIDH